MPLSESQVVELMESSKTEQEWNNNCDVIKKDAGGYPSFWYKAIVQSGVSDRAADNFGRQPGIQIIGHK